MNILLSCSGRRNYLVQYFEDALRGTGRVFVADASDQAPTALEGRGSFLRVPPVSDESYHDALLEACHRNSIKLLISLNDFELPLLARQSSRFHSHGIIPVVSSPDVVELCFDKWRTFLKLSELGIPTPMTALGLASAEQALASGRLVYPVVVKPRWGTASVSIEVAHDSSELRSVYEVVKLRLRRSAVGAVSEVPLDEKVIIQQMLTGLEYGVDIVNDLSGEHHAVILKRKLAMRAGETDRAITEEQPAIAALAQSIATAIKPTGLVDCDAFLTSEGPCILELNPRFGGGYPFSHAAGANVPAALIAWAKGEEVDNAWLRATPGVISAKCDRLVTRWP
jgi:carbamoyl-phosphate synthase large subunit